MITLPEPSQYAPQMITEDAYTREQLIEYGRACAAEMQERCARVCDGSYGVNVALDDEEAYFGRQMADAIRALKDDATEQK